MLGAIPGNPETPISPGGPCLGKGGKGFKPGSPFGPYQKSTSI